MFLVYVRFGPGVDGIGSMLVERGTPGFTIRSAVRIREGGEEWCQLYFENCRVPKANLLLGPGGFKRQISGFNVERIGNATRALALGRYAFNLAREHASVRKQFGRPLCEFQGLQWKFADMAVKLERRAASALSCRDACRYGAAVAANETARSQNWLATRQVSRSPTRRCRSWADLAIAKSPSRSIACAAREVG